MTFLTWLWEPKPTYRSQFCAAHVNTLAAMVRRHYPKPHRFMVVTDIPKGVDASIEVVPAWNDFANVASPYGAHQPSCYRRLRAFHPEIGKVFGERFVSLDLDTVIVGDLSPLFDRPDDFVIWREQDPRSLFNGSMFMLKAGTRPQVWTLFDPRNSPIAAKRANKFGSDQGHLSHVLSRDDAATWDTSDGVYSYRLDILAKGGALPENAKVVNFHGGVDPWSPSAARLDWVKEHYRVAF